jgi:hypothetical protein
MLNSVHWDFLIQKQRKNTDPFLRDDLAQEMEKQRWRHHATKLYAFHGIRDYMSLRITDICTSGW